MASAHEPRLRPLSGIYAIVDPTQISSLSSVARALFEGGVGTLQIRAKRATREQRSSALRELAPLCLSMSRRLVINDDLALAEAPLPGLWGLHLGQDDLNEQGGLDRALRVCTARGLALGVSTHNLEQVRAAQVPGVDHIGFGPVQATQSKANPDPVVGFAGLKQACLASQKPVVAIGGLGLSDLPACRAAGASAVAMISALAGEGPDSLTETARAACAAFGMDLP